MKQNAAALLCGVLFGVGLSLSHMINPVKVLNFLDILGNWDPSLLFVMLGALAVAIAAFKWVLKRPAPLLADSFQLTKTTTIDGKLILGAGLFGIGWGMTGYCPGPAIAGIGLFSLESVIVVFAIVIGFFVYSQLFERD